MKTLLVLLLLMTPAAAQQAYTLKLTEAELNLVGKGLGKLPFEEVAATINVIMQQVTEQQKAAKTSANEEHGK